MDYLKPETSDAQGVHFLLSGCQELLDANQAFERGRDRIAHNSTPA